MTFKHTLPRALTFATLTLGAQLGFAADKVTFQLDWLPGGDKAPVYVGIEEGFFADEDLEVRVVSGRGSTDAITKLVAGQADVGLSDLVSLLVARAQDDNIPVKGIYSVFSEAPHAFFSVEGSGIESVKDVAGKTVATSPFSSSNLFFPLLLDVNQVDESGIKLVKTDPGALNPMLLTGRTDVVISWVTDTEKYQAMADQAGKTLNVMPWYDAGLAFYSTSVIASERFLEERPKVARRFVKAYAKAIEYTWAHPQESGAMVHAQVPDVDPAMAADTIRSIRPLVYNEASETQGMGAFNPERLATTWHWTAKAQEIDEASFDPETAVDRSFMPGS
ncbi:ABC transporter substrate-binding protein [Marinobacter sp. JSM 1782161]|uniref:ABC transporter substrate-binding protein n=1 Tax=Marinobacter sp. JSM 1782161 TaxID=2685906 RepID=UPI0014027482|nr:ABC transporter substrate-binding protein [Marinobacter sp. JSM 1782161]